MIGITNKDRANKLRKIGYIFTLAVIALYLILKISIEPTDGVDYMWHYSLSKAIKNGYTMYRDMFDVTTPLYYWLLSLPLHIDDRFYMYMVYEGIFTATVFLIYNLCLGRTCKKRDFLRTILCALPIIHLLPEYNMLLNILCIIAMTLLKVIEENKDKPTSTPLYAMGAVCGLMILTKHTLGILYSGVLFICFLYMIRSKSYKYSAKDILKPAASLCITIAPFIIYLILSDTLTLFIEGSRQATYLIGRYADIFEKEALPLFIFTECFVFISLIKNYINKDAYGIMISSLAAFSCISLYPVSNLGHFFMVLMIILFSTIYTFNDFIENKTIRYLLVLTILMALIYTLSLTVSGKNAINRIVYNIPETNDHIYMKKEVYEKDAPLIEYIRNHPQYDFISPDYNYSQITIASGRKVKPELCMFVYGGIGHRKPVETMKMFNSSSTLYFVDKKSTFYQTPVDAKSWIIDHGDIIYSTDRYDIYSVSDIPLN